MQHNKSAADDAYEPPTFGKSTERDRSATVKGPILE